MKYSPLYHHWKLIPIAGILIALLVEVGGCTTLEVKTDYLKSFDFNKVKTYSWYPDKSSTIGVYPDRMKLVAGAIKAAVEKELGAKGIKPSATGKSDVLVVYHAGARTKKEQEDWGYKYGMHTPRSTGPYEQVTYRQGTLIVDLIDPTSKEVVWRGIANAVMSGSRPPTAKVKPRIQEAIGEMFSKYPPR